MSFFWMWASAPVQRSALQTALDKLEKPASASVRQLPAELPPVQQPWWHQPKQPWWHVVDDSGKSPLEYGSPWYAFASYGYNWTPHYYSRWVHKETPPDKPWKE
jgi:hypothetical protein